MCEKTHQLLQTKNSQMRLAEGFFLPYWTLKCVNFAAVRLPPCFRRAFAGGSLEHIFHEILTKITLKARKNGPKSNKILPLAPAS